MKKPKDKKRRKKRRRGPLGRAGTPPRGALVPVEDGAKAEPEEEAEEEVYLCFGKAPKAGTSRNWLRGSAEAGLSVVLGRKNRRRGGYVVEVPLDLLPTKQLVSQSLTLTRLAANLRPVYVAVGAEEAGTGAGGEPLLGGGFRLKPVPRFVRVDMPGW